jgi:hypothetical protein
MAQFKAVYDNPSKTGKFFYAIVEMDADSKAQYIADQGVNPESGKSWYSGDISTGPNAGKPSFRCEANFGPEIMVRRSSGKNGKFSWYPMKTESSFLNSLVAQNPALADTKFGFAKLETDARAQYLLQFAEEPIEIEASADGSPDTF